MTASHSSIVWLALLAVLSIPEARAQGDTDPPPHIAAINRRLVEHDIDVHGIGADGGDLESIFMDLIGSQAA